MPTSTTSPVQATYSFNILDIPSFGLIRPVINDRGDIAASFQEANGTNAVFVDHGGTISVHELSAAPYVFSINDHDVVFGSVADQPLPINYTPFVIGGGTFPIGFTVSAYPEGGINNSGEIVGSTGSYLNNAVHGFTYQNGIITTFDVPGASLTIPSAVNNAGDIVGSYYQQGSTEHGFLYHNGQFTTVDFPGYSSSVMGINNHGEIVGDYFFPYPSSPINEDAFLYKNGHYTDIHVPGALQTHATAVNDQGTVVGGYYAAGLHHGFVYDNGTLTKFDVPGSQYTYITGFNNHGEIVGWSDKGIFTATPGGSGVTHTAFDFSSVSPTTFAPPASGTILTDSGASGGSGGLSSMSTSLLDPSMLVTPHIPT